MQAKMAATDKQKPQLPELKGMLAKKYSAAMYISSLSF